MTRFAPLAADGRAALIAIDHGLYSWPCRGLEDRAAVLAACASAGIDGVIASYGTIRDLRPAFGPARPILKLDLAPAGLGSHYAVAEHVPAWTLDDAQRLGVDTVMTFVQLGAPFALEALRQAARIAAEADRRGLSYLCEILPVASPAFPDPEAGEAIVAAARTGQELGAHAIKTTIPRDPEAMAEAAAACGIPVILAGGNPARDPAAYWANLRHLLAQGAAGLAIGRNAWGAADPRAAIAGVARLVHGGAGR